MTYIDRQNEVKVRFADETIYTPELTNFVSSKKHFLEEYNGLGTAGTTDATDNGVSLRKIPLIFTFYGDDHDTTSDAFEKSASQIGDVYIQPPYGKEIKCIISTISRKYSTVNDIAATVFDVQFVEISGIKTPVGGETAEDGITAQVEDVNESATSMFSKAIARTTAEKNALIASFSDSVDAVNAQLRPIAKLGADVLTAFDATYASIKANIDDVILFPQTIASQATALMALPSTIAGKASSFISGYSSLISSQFLLPFSLNNTGKNNAVNSQFFAGSALASLSSALVTSDYDNAPEVINIAEQYIEIYNTYRLNIDNIQVDFDVLTVELDDRFIQTGELDVPLNYLAQQAAGALVDEAFEAKKEIKISLDYETTFINLAIQYYPERFVLEEEATLEYVISSNNLTEDELILIPRRRELVVYV